MNKTEKIELEQRKALQTDGWQVEKKQSIESNDGFVNEQEIHLLGKIFSAKFLASLGYRINSEVRHERGHAEIDILAYGLRERLTYAVEIETSPKEKVIESKQEKYLTEHVDDMLVVDMSKMPMNMLDAQEYVHDQLGL
jgi:hypothetical protein